MLIQFVIIMTFLRDGDEKCPTGKPLSCECPYGETFDRETLKEILKALKDE
jgi:hypothetical protein